jgi:hypothetical protein
MRSILVFLLEALARMRPRPRLGLSLIPPLLLSIFLACGLGEDAEPMLRSERVALREEVRALFHHSYDSYMEHAFPADVLLPLSCAGKDGWGSFSLTLIDSLDTLALLGNATEFEARVRWVAEHVSFDVDETVSLFETTIRALGGLLSAHLLALDPQLGLMRGAYEAHGGLLPLAVDLASRLLPALDTASGIPFGSVNLRHGVAPDEAVVTCTAAAGTLSLEFGTLSRLTGDGRFEARRPKTEHGTTEQNTFCRHQPHRRPSCPPARPPTLLSLRPPPSWLHPPAPPPSPTLAPTALFSPLHTKTRPWPVYHPQHHPLHPPPAGRGAPCSHSRVRPPFPARPARRAHRPPHGRVDASRRGRGAGHRLVL